MLFRRSQILTHRSAFKPSLPIPPYKHEQTQSPLIDLLPAELRNKIYAHVFTFENQPLELAASAGPSPHPLSLLLTCRRIYHEAAILAFGTYSFLIHSDPQWTYLRLRAAVSSFSNHQVEAIRSLSVVSGSSRNTGLALVNALVVFPRLHQFIIRIERRRNNKHQWHPVHQPTHPADNQSENVYLQAVKNYAPCWFSYVVEIVIGGHAYAWQDGSKWIAQWPQMESALCYTMVEYGQDGTVREELRMDTDAVGVVDGVQACRCGCNNVLWTAAILKQEGGRKVEIVFHKDDDDDDGDDGDDDDEEEPKKEGTSVSRVLLVPGTTPSTKVNVREAGMGYEVNEEYWEAIRRRNGNLSALCRGLWRRAVWPVTVADDKGVAFEVASEVAFDVERA